MKRLWRVAARRDLFVYGLVSAMSALTMRKGNILSFLFQGQLTSASDGKETKSYFAKRSYSTLPLLAAAGRTAADSDVALLTERGREGVFVFSKSNLSAKVKTDPAQGVYIASSSDVTGAAGAWVRQFSDLIPEYFGSVGDGTSKSASPTISAWIDYAKANDIREIKADGHYYLPAGKQTISEHAVSKGDPVFDLPTYYAVMIDGANDLTIDLSRATIITDHGTALCVYASTQTRIINGTFLRTGTDDGVISNQSAAICITRSHACIGKGQKVDGYYRNLMVYRASASGFEDYDSRNALYYCAYASSVLDIKLSGTPKRTFAFLRRGLHIGGRYGGALSDESEVSGGRFYNCSPRNNSAAHIKTERMNVKWFDNKIYESAAQNSGDVINGISVVPTISVGTAARAVIFNNKVRGCYIGINVRGVTDFQIRANDIAGYFQTGLALVSDRLGGSQFALQRGIVTQNYIGAMADDSSRRSIGNDKNAGLQIEQNIALIDHLYVGHNTVDAVNGNIAKKPEFGMYVEVKAGAVGGISTNRLIGALTNRIPDQPSPNIR
ncbi:hypothetical protein [Parasphingorhabdus sp.]|uniref:hypothetical protein n=1 Tax=Parasphingorhabdus sp. TaxID=2709688 RepID=UPI003A8DF8F7